MGKTTEKRRDISNFLVLAQMIRDEEEKLKEFNVREVRPNESILDVLKPHSHSSHSWGTIEI